MLLQTFPLIQHFIGNTLVCAFACVCVCCKFYCCCRYRLWPLCWRYCYSYYHTTHYTLLLQLFLQRFKRSLLFFFFISAALCLAFWAVIRSLVKSFISPSVPLARRPCSHQPTLVVAAACCAKSRLANRFINGNKIIKEIKKKRKAMAVMASPLNRPRTFFPYIFLPLCPLVFNSIGWLEVACTYI